MVKRLYFSLSLVVLLISVTGNDLATKVPKVDANNGFPMPDDVTAARSSFQTSSDAASREEDLERFPSGPQFSEKRKYLQKSKEVKEDTCSLSIKHDEMLGVITSPNYPNEYPNNITCLWKVRAPPEHLIYVSFKNFRLESGIRIASSCPFDYLYIFEEFTVKRPYDTRDIRYQRKMGTFCGDTVPENLQSRKTGSSVYFYFHTDESKRETGFSLSYRFLQQRYQDSADERKQMIARRKKLDGFATHTTIADLWNDEETDVPSMEEEFLKIFSCVVFVFVFFTVLLGTLYKCWKSTSEQLDADGHAHHSCCCGAIRLDVVAGGSRNQGSRLNQCDSSPRLPTPPPEYGEVVKTEEDWNRVIQQLGEASATALRQRMATEELQVTYDLGDTERNDVITTTSSLNMSSCTDSASASTLAADQENRAGNQTSPGGTQQGVLINVQPTVSSQALEEEEGISTDQLVG